MIYVSPTLSPTLTSMNMTMARGTAAGAGMVRETRCTASEGGQGTSAARGDGGRVVCHRAGSNGEEHRKI